jgi:hypothetical protein
MRSLILSAAVLVSAASLAAQEDRLFYFQQPVPAPSPGAAGTVRFISGLIVGNTVKASPFSAESINESSQTLADGNRIVNRQVTKLYRDSEGRERREMSIGPDGKDQIVMISDPVAETSYTLHPGDKTAEKMPRAQLTLHTAGVEAGAAGVAIGGDVLINAAPRTMIINKQVQLLSAPVAGPPGNEESLGAKTIEGVMAQGTRIRNTIPAGQIGNEKPIETITETWYSPDLKMTVLSETSDPRMGKTVMKLANISRSEPPRSLFEVPADYTVVQSPGPEIDRAIDGLKMRKREAERLVK